MGRFSFEDKNVWVTGASAGIGSAIAIEMSRRGSRVALSARREEKLKEVRDECKGDDHIIEPLDVTDRERNQEVVDSIVEAFGGLDVAFLNAGVFGTLGDEAFDADEFEWNMKVNYLGTVYGIESALPHLRESDDGYLAGMSSAAAYGPLARGSAYGSSKAATKYMLDSLNFEWDDKDVDVDTSVVCPGVVRTPMTDDEDFPYDPPPSFMEVSPEWAAEYIANKMEKKKHEISFPFSFILMLKFVANLPGPLHRWSLKMMSRANVSKKD